MLDLGENFRLLLRATDYFDFITLIMLAMGLIFQMPAITYVLSRIGLVSAQMLIKSWKIAIVVILIVAAVVSPTGDIPCAYRRALSSVVCRTFAVSRYTLSTISFGVPRGATNPNQPAFSKPGTASAIVGASGTCGIRVLLVTPSARSLPPVMKLIDAARFTTPKSSCPLTMSVIAGPSPL
jgi:hypothetical protein